MILAIITSGNSKSKAILRKKLLQVGCVKIASNTFVYDRYQSRLINDLKKNNKCCISNFVNHGHWKRMDRRNNYDRKR